MTDAVSEWMHDYRRAWQSNEPEHIRALFTEEALYYPEPFTRPARGTSEIIALWLKKRDEPGDTTFTWSIVAQTDALTIVQGETAYRGGPTYSNLWLIRFDDDGRATEFTEWWMDQANPA